MLFLAGFACMVVGACIGFLTSGLLHTAKAEDERTERLLAGRRAAAPPETQQHGTKP